MKPKDNELHNETSPYLLQHAGNPVHWKAWNKKTLTTAKAEGKLMIVSIGYAACHWCHVMEHESFEDQTVADVMNKDYISVKVDREERPDIDQIYINAVQLMTGHAGWPLNVITLPDGRPVWGGTYFKKQQWVDALQQIQQVYKASPEKLEEYASRLEDGVKNMDLVQLNTDEADFSSFDMTSLIEKWSRNFDQDYGGYKQAPKFMMPNNYLFLLRYAVQNNDKSFLEYVDKTLTKMAYGGIYDAVGGGFSRYSVDGKWHVPHFEKMLYDNAQLVSLYSKAYAHSKKPLYKEVVEETLQFVSETLTNDEGAFYSSLDADSETNSGKLEEGAYYVYAKEELQNLLKEDFNIFQAYYNINDFGKWEDCKYVLIRNNTDAEVAETFSISEETLRKKKENWKQILLNHRNKRPKPRLDDKTLTSWNGLMLKGYVDAYKTFQKQEYLDAALRNAKFITARQLQDDGALFHNYKNGNSTINGYLEDYAAVIEAFIALYQVTLDENWLDRSKKMADYAFRYFFDDKTQLFYFTSTKDDKLMTRLFEYRDNVIPASNSMMAKNLFKLSRYYNDTRYATTAKQMLNNILGEITTYPIGFSNWLDLLENYRSKFYEVVIVGEAATEKTKELTKTYLPNALVAGSTKKSSLFLMQDRFVKDETLVYVCMDNTCNTPVSEIKKAINTIKKN
ncbi:thioredoxin domain-containing protein [Marixanthomonas spongiae]|uniref:thioredoxin domain-containing protein n=1 Tax=Marixanthomonas spongiae TaxID=2174845 RepID=UPI001F0C4CA2|nr:thioredoxin domain-containing protein [Marixanthomonas spongiae]